jgi:hypothetical protein
MILRPKILPLLLTNKTDNFLIMTVHTPIVIVDLSLESLIVKIQLLNLNLLSRAISINLPTLHPPPTLPMKPPLTEIPTIKRTLRPLTQIAQLPDHLILLHIIQLRVVFVMAVVFVVLEAGLVDEDLLAGLLVAAGFAGGELGLEVL